MGRPERPVDPAAGPVQRLAHELRELRKAAGSPSYRTMAKAAGFSATALSLAAAGERLPSLAVVQGYVRACGGDPAGWELRWKAAEAEADQAPAEYTEDAPSPYRGLARFEPDDRHLFFGRARMVDEVGHLVCEHRFAVLFGPSGSGKSSLLRAGLIPRLQEEIAARGCPAVLRILTPGARPATTYGHLLSPAEDEPESWVVVDQFEEVFTLCRDPQERSRFVDLLLAARAPDSRLRVLVAVRADFYARCAEHRGLADALHGAGLLLGPMTADELRQAVTGPAQAAGCRVERTLTARLVDEVQGEPGGLPMLSHVLLETWRRRKGRMLTLAGYEAAGGVRGAIAASAEKVYGGLSPAQAGAARRVLLRMVEPGQGTPDTRRPLTRAELEEWADADVRVVVERLTRARLLTADETGLQLAHEALITCWPRLHGWIEEDRERLRHHRMLADAARTWLEHERDPGDLYRGSRLARAEELFSAPAADLALTVPERAFLAAALEARAAEQRAAARTARRHRFLTVSLSAVLAVALLTAVAVWRAYDDNERRRTQEAARRIADVADSLRTTDPRTAQLLGVAAWRVARLPQTRRALLGSLAQPEADSFSDPEPGEDAARFLTGSGRTLLTVEGRTWRTWDVADHRRLASGRLPSDGRVDAVSPDGRLLAVHGSDGVRLWDTAAGQWRGGLLPGSSLVGFSGNTYVVSDIDDTEVQVRAAADGRPLFATRAENAQVVAVSADGRLVASCPLKGGAPQVRDLGGGGRTLPGGWEHGGEFCGRDQSLLTLGGGRSEPGVPPAEGRERLAALTAGGASVWDVRSGRHLADLRDPGVQYLSFSADGRFLATADGQEIRVWRLGVEAPVFRHSQNNQHLYGQLEWDPDRPLLRYLEGGTVHTLDVSAATTSAWREQPLDRTLLSPDGRTLATARRIGDHYRVDLLDPHDGRLLRTLPAPRLPVSTDPSAPVSARDTFALLAFTPDGKAFAYGVSAPSSLTSRQPLTIWDLTKGRVRATLDLAAKASTAAAVTIALAPDARTLYAARTGAAAHPVDEVWDTARGRRTALLPGLSSSHLAIGPDSRVLVGDNRVAALPSGKVTDHDLVQIDGIGALAFAPDGSLLAAGDQSGRVAVWDAGLRQKRGILGSVFPALPDGGDVLTGDTSEGVSALAVSPDGTTLAVAGETGSLQLWDIATQQPLGGLLTTPGEKIDTVAFSADSGTLYAASAHVPLQRYTVDPARAVTTVCARTGGGGLTRAQWQNYVRDVPYQRVCGG
ncbi:nSTAND1 domain-containing NTPase [Streptomyces sp. NPDC001492]